MQKSYDSLTLYSLLNEKIYESITPLDKRKTLQNLYKNAFIYARLLEYKGIKYLTNSFLVYKNRKAAVKEAAIMIWRNPEFIIKDSIEKEKEVNAFIIKIYDKFLEIFGTDSLFIKDRQSLAFLQQAEDALQLPEPTGKLQ